MNILQQLKSPGNQSILIRIINDLIKEQYHITLNDDFNRILNDILDFNFDKFGKKPNNLGVEEHLKNLNKLAIQESLKYIGQNIHHFPKLDNSQYNTKVEVIRDNTPVASSGSIVPYHGPPNSNDWSQNQFKNTEDLYKQMSYNQNQNQGHNNQPNFALPMELNGQKPAEQALMEIMEQRRNAFPAMNTPSYQPPGSTSTGPNSSTNSSQTLPLMNLILQSPIAMQNPSLVPAIINEISQMTSLTDLMNKNPAAFQARIMDPNFLSMLVTNLKNRGDSKMKPMNMNDDPPSPNTKLGELPTNPEDPLSEFSRRMNAYKQGQGPGQGETESFGYENLMNKHIPPSDLLVNNTLPNLEVPQLIDYHLSLDFRTDLENSAKNRYLLKFNKYGNVSKVKLNSCLIPENDYLTQQPYIFIKVEELGGRVFTANHDCVYGKLILSENRNGYLYYKPDDHSCLQIFSQPKILDKFTVSFLNYQGQYINLKEIQIHKQLKLKKQNKLKFITEHRHKLVANEDIQIHIHRSNLNQIDEYNIPVDAILDDRTFTVDNVFEVLTDKIKVMKTSVNCSMTFQLSEINWNLLTNKNPQNAQLIRLSQLVNEKKAETLEHKVDKALAESIKSQIPTVISVPQTPLTTPPALPYNVQWQ